MDFYHEIASDFFLFSLTVNTVELRKTSLFDLQDDHF